MLYDYLCPTCDITTSIIKSMSEYNSPESCTICKSPMDKIYNRINFFSRPTSWPEYNPAFGKVIKSTSHRNEEAKQRGWIEIGNENPDKIASNLEKDRKNDWERKWNDNNAHLQGVG